MTNIFDQQVHNWLETAGNVKPADETTANVDKCQLAIDLIQEELDELKVAYAERDTQEAIDAVVDLKWVINNFIFFFGMDTDALANIEKLIETSNFSKFCTNEEDAQTTVDLYGKGEHPDKPGEVIEAHWKKAESEDATYYVILRKTDDKILKSYKYKSVTELLGDTIDLSKESETEITG